jgi:hypothetical protein
VVPSAETIEFFKEQSKDKLPGASLFTEICCLVILGIMHKTPQRCEQFLYEFVAKQHMFIECHVGHVRCDSAIG